MVSNAMYVMIYEKAWDKRVFMYRQSGVEPLLAVFAMFFNHTCGTLLVPALGRRHCLPLL